jgi:hypothetical protein
MAAEQFTGILPLRMKKKGPDRIRSKTYRYWIRIREAIKFQFLSSSWSLLYYSSSSPFCPPLIFVLLIILFYPSSSFCPPIILFFLGLFVSSFYLVLFILFFSVPVSNSRPIRSTFLFSLYFPLFIFLR